MNLSIFIAIIFCHLGHSQFSFFYQEDISKSLYQNSQDTILKVNFPFTKEMKESNKKFSEVLVAITKPYNLTLDKYKGRDNPIYLNIDDYGFWLGKFHTIYDNYVKLTSNDKIYQPLVFDKEMTLAVDSNYAVQKYKNIAMFKDIISQTMNLYANVSKLETSKPDTLVVVGALELLISDFKHFINTFRDLYQTLNLADSHQISDILSDRMSSKFQKIDWDNTQILKSGTFEKSANFIIQMAQQSAPLEYFELKPISYYGYQLENDYYKVKTTGKIQKHNHDEKLTPQDTSNINKCLEGLNKNNHDQVFENCVFVKTENTYEVLNKGILFNNGTNQVITQINKMFHSQYKETDFPIVIHFNGSLNLFDKSSKPLTISKRYQNSLQKSSLSTKNLETLKNTLFTPEENHIISVLQEEMMGVLLSFLSILTLLITMYLSRCIYIKLRSSKKSQKPQEKLLIKKLKANRRN
jgi:hypothetical protein